MKTKIVFIILLVLTLLSIPVSAHSGRTDSQGGHYNRSTGEYHFHHGFPAHQHINGICPYANTEPSKKAGSSSSSIASSGSSGYSSSSSVANKSDDSKKGISIDTFIGLGIFSLIIIFAIIGNSLRLIDFFKERKMYTKLYGGKNPLDFIDIPDDTIIGEDDLPHIKDIYKPDKYKD